MATMPNVHIREVPPDALQTLRAAARRHRRSLNAELVDALVRHAQHVEREETLREVLGEVRRRWREAFPEGFPPGLEPETVVRQDRAAR